MNEAIKINKNPCIFAKYNAFIAFSKKIYYFGAN